MESTITAVYKMVVYENGKVELIPQPIEYVFDKLDIPFNVTTMNISERIRQIMSVIAYVHQEVSTRNYWGSLNTTIVSKLVSAAYKKIAGENSIAEQTVADKCGRQLGLTKSGFVELLLHYFIASMQSSDYLQTNLYKVLSKNVANAADDLKYINERFEQLKDCKKEEL